MRSPKKPVYWCQITTLERAFRMNTAGLDSKKQDAFGQHLLGVMNHAALALMNSLGLPENLWVK